MDSSQLNILIRRLEILPLVLFLIFMSCKKENDVDTDRIVIGDYHSMYVDSTEISIEASYNDFGEILLDLDLDDSADLRLVVAMYGSPGMGVHYVSELQPLDSWIMIYGAYSGDTTFLDRKIRIYQDEYNTYKSITENYSCQRKNQTDQVIRVETVFHPRVLEKDDILSLSDMFASDTESFIYQWSSPVYTYVENDTVIVESSNSLFDCHSIPYGKEVFLGFKLSGPADRLGWIKIILGSEARITLKEFAIQKL
jgi:hypothetical protein